jgi:hypothetical protein
MLSNKIRNLYPELTDADFAEHIQLRDDSDGRGPYIAAWNHPTLPQPTDEQLATASDAAPREIYTCSPWQIRKALLDRGLRQSVEDAVAASTDYVLRDGWEYATEIKSNDSFVIIMGQPLGLDQDGIDELIQYAGTL